MNNFSEEKISHQGVIATISPVEYIDFDDFMQNLPKEGFKKVIIFKMVIFMKNRGGKFRTVSVLFLSAVMLIYISAQLIFDGATTKEFNNSYIPASLTVGFENSDAGTESEKTESGTV